ncbi:MAG: hypothetical protein LUO79_04225 [Methanomassiliicoccales archaeon]|nr:hypothetical protein [Methanomassiliicoccales archaeon]
MVRMVGSTRLLAVAIAGLFFATMFVGMATPVNAAAVPAWTQMPNMGTNRSQAVVVTGSDGLIYVMGGFTSVAAGPAADANSYNPKTGEWKDLADMPLATRGAAGAADTNGKVYVFGGDAGGVVATTQIYDIATDAWSTGADMPAVRWEAKAAYTNGYIYVAGGYSAATQSTVWYYSPSGDSWNVKPALPAPRMAGALLAVGSDIYYIGGLSGISTAVDDVYRLNVYSGVAWDSIATLPVNRGALAGTVGPDGVMYVFGGGTNWYNIDEGNVTGYYYDWSSATWKSLPDLPLAVRYSGATGTNDGRIWCLGGSNATAVFNRVFSMQVASYTLVPTPTSVGQGQFLMVTITPSFAFTVPTAYGTYGYIVGPDGSIYGTTSSGGMGPSIYIPEGRSFAVVMPIPQGAPVGAYTFVLTGIEFSTVGDFGGFLDGKNATFDVVAALSTQEQIALLQDQIAHLQSMVGANDTALLAQIAALQTQLTALQNKQLDSTTGTIILVLVVIAIIIMLVVMVLLLRKK